MGYTPWRKHACRFPRKLIYFFPLKQTAVESIRDGEGLGWGIRKCGVWLMRTYNLGGFEQVIHQ